MTQQSGRGYKPHERNGVAEQAIDRTRELAEEALDRADEWLKPTGLSIKERPMTVLAVVGGLAFAAGAAFWMFEELAAAVALRRSARDPFRPAPPRRVALSAGGASFSPTGLAPRLNTLNRHPA